MGIYYPEEVQYLAKENPQDDYYIVVGGDVRAIDRSGLKTVLHTCADEEYVHLDIIESETKQYLRFEYEHGTYEDDTPRKEWLHVTHEGTQWY